MTTLNIIAESEFRACSLYLSISYKLRVRLVSEEFRIVPNYTGLIYLLSTNPSHYAPA